MFRELMYFSQSFRTRVFCCGLNLYEARGTGQRFFEKFQRIIIIQHLDGVRQSSQFFRSSFHDNFPLFFFLFTILIQVCQEFFICDKCLLGVTKIVFHFRNFNTQISNPCQFGFNLLCQCSHFFFFCRHQFFIRGNCCFLCLCSLREASSHLVTHCLQDPCNLTALRCIARFLRVG